MGDSIEVLKEAQEGLISPPEAHLESVFDERVTHHEFLRLASVVVAIVVVVVVVILIVVVFFNPRTAIDLGALIDLEDGPLEFQT